jgi:hypothetical protein
LVSKDAVKEAEAERKLVQDSSSLCNVSEDLLGRKPLRSMGEEVFLAQLHRRAFLLNDGFQNQIMQVLSRYESVNGVKRKGAGSQSDSNGPAVQVSADLILKPSMTESFAREEPESTNASISERSWRTADSTGVLFECMFADGVGAVEVHPAPIKT